MSMQQEPSEPIIKFLHRLRNGIRYCEFEQTIEEWLIQIWLIEGNIYMASHIKCSNSYNLEIWISILVLNLCISRILHLNTSDIRKGELEIFVSYHGNKRNKYSKRRVWCYGHELNKDKCPAFGRLCINYKKKNYFQPLCKIK